MSAPDPPLVSLTFTGIIPLPPLPWSWAVREVEARDEQGQALYQLDVMQGTACMRVLCTTPQLRQLRDSLDKTLAGGGDLAVVRDIKDLDARSQFGRPM